MLVKKINMILFVKDQALSRDFYRALLKQEPQLDVPGMTEFRINEAVVLGLMPSKGIIRVLENKIKNPDDAQNTPRCELYITVENPEQSINDALNAGAKLVSPLQKRNWGDMAGYVSDPDGHLIAFAALSSV